MLKTKQLENINELGVIIVEYHRKNQSKKFNKTFVYVKLNEDIFVYYSRKGKLKIRLADTILNNARGFSATRASLKDFLLHYNVSHSKFYKDVRKLLKEENG